MGQQQHCVYQQSMNKEASGTCKLVNQQRRRGKRGGGGAHLVEDNTRVEHKGGVKEMLQLPHELIGLAAPLHLHKGSHIAPCAMLTLQEANALWAQH